MKAQLLKESDREYVCEILDIPTSGGRVENIRVGAREVIGRIYNQFITEKVIDYGMGKDRYLVYIKGLGLLPVQVLSAIEQPDKTCVCEYLAYLKPMA